MKLDGDLASFGLPGIVNLLSSSRATGALVLRRSTPVPVTGVLWFRDGAVTGATADTTRRALLRRVVALVPLPEDQVSDAVAGAAGGGPGPVRRLLDRGVVDADTVQRAATESVGEALADLLGWTEGTFSVDPESEEPDDVGLALPAPDLLEQARARSLVWDEHADVVPGPDSVLAMPLVPGDEPRLARDEWAALALVDGRRSVAEVVLLSGAGPQRVLPVVAGLVRRGLLGVREPGAVDPMADVERRLAHLERLLAGERGPVAAAADPVWGGAAATATALPDPIRRPLPDPRGVARPDPLPTATATVGSVAVALDPLAATDPTINRSMLLRLIAGVRGL